MRGPSMRRAPNLKPLSRRRTTLVGAAIGLCVALALALFRRTDAVESLEWRTVDMRTRSCLGDTGPDPRLVVASISETDVATMRKHGYEWPWPLDLNAMAFRWMAHCGVAGVVV